MKFAWNGKGGAFVGALVTALVTPAAVAASPAQQARDNQASLEEVRAQYGKLAARERVARKHRRRGDCRRRVAHRGECHQELCRGDNLCRHDACPGDGNHDGCDCPRAFTIQVLYQVGECVFPVLVCPRGERDECEEPEGTRKHEPAGGPAEFCSGIYGPDYGRPAENCGHQAPCNGLCRSPLARHEKVGNVLHAPRTAHGDQHQDNEINNQCNIHNSCGTKIIFIAAGQLYLKP